MHPSLVLTFLAVSVVLTVLPGPDSLLVVRNGMRGWGQAVAVGLGVAVASLGWGVLAAFGVAALVARSAELYTMVKIAGALYLFFLGLRAVWASRRRPGPPAAEQMPSGVPAPPVRGVLGALRTGMVSGLLNPKVGLFYVAVLPQLVPGRASVFWSTLLFASVDAVVVVAYTCLLAVLAAALVGYLRRPSVLRGAERATGICLLGLGARAAFEQH